MAAPTLLLVEIWLVVSRHQLVKIFMVHMTPKILRISGLGVKNLSVIKSMSDRGVGFFETYFQVSDNDPEGYAQ